MAENPNEVTIGGVTYRLREVGPAEFKEVEKRVAEKRKSPLEIVCSKLDKIPPQHQQDMLTAALEKEPKFDDPPQEDIDAYLATRDGIIFFWWLSVRKNHPEVGLEDANRLFTSMLQEEVRKATEQQKQFLGETPWQVA